MSIRRSRLPCTIYRFTIKARAILAWESLGSRPVWGLVTRERARVVSLFIVISSHTSFQDCLSLFGVLILSKWWTNWQDSVAASHRSLLLSRGCPRYFPSPLPRRRRQLGA